MAEPVLPLENCLCALTLERMGRSLADLAPRALCVFGTERSAELERIVASVEYTHGDLYRLGIDILAGSTDADAFLEVGIPGLMIGAGPSQDLGRPTDTVERIDMPSLVARAE